MASLDSILAARKNRNAVVTAPNLTDDIVDGIKSNQQVTSVAPPKKVNVQKKSSTNTTTKSNSIKKQTSNLTLKERFDKEPIDASSSKKALTLEDDLARFIKKRSKQCGVPMQYYINILIAEDIVRSETRDLDLYDECENKFKGKKERLTFSFTPDNLDHINNEITKHGITFTAFMNYIVAEEVKRENIYGKRI